MAHLNDHIEEVLQIRSRLFAAFSQREMSEEAIASYVLAVVLSQIADQIHELKQE